MPDARRGNRWVLTVNNCMPKKKPEGGSQDSFCALLALLYDAVERKNGILGLCNYREAEEWTYGEVAKRIKMLAALIAAKAVGGQYVQETRDARIIIQGRQGILNEILEGEQEASGDPREISKKADSNIEKIIKSILDPNSILILNAKGDNPNLTGPFAKVTEEEKKLILAYLGILRETEFNRQRVQYDKFLF